MSTVLYVGNRNYSSWSLRPWLVLRWSGLPFETRDIRLDQPGYGEQAIAEVRAVSPGGTLPALAHDGLALWDSLAIAEWAAEQVPPGRLWPRDPARRAVARAVTCEMHGGFGGVRRDLSMNIHRRVKVDPARWPEDTRRGLARLEAIFSGLRARHAGEGPWLFGERSIADAFFTPVATRLRTYGVAIGATAQAYCDTLLADADFRAWEASCVGERWDREGFPVIDALWAEATRKP
jgi:glutathione S-transferase